ncbi:hypothetical protein LDO32_11080 [Luteimonas sp. Y-2-2-4F]|nr:DUF6689 family protein [Luteimonas sp. Y-2-2-4F]MCD9032267.1 hypothetical protein [Luteimonas sp. Y-2-2-4F]
MSIFHTAARLFAALLLGLSAAMPAAAQTLPVSVDVSGQVASVRIGSAVAPLARLTLTFEDAVGLSAASLGIQARLVGLDDPQLLSRLADPALLHLDGQLPLLISVEPPAGGGLRLQRTVQVEVYTQLLAYSVGSSYRLFKAQPGGPFRDITREIAPGSVRARGTTGGFSQFLVLTDLRPTSAVVAGKFAALRARVDGLAAAERPPLAASLDTAETAVAAGDYDAALGALDGFSAHVRSRAGHGIAQVWRATRDADNDAGELLAGASTLGFSIGYLRDFGL